MPFFFGIDWFSSPTERLPLPLISGRNASDVYDCRQGASATGINEGPRQVKCSRSRTVYPPEAS
ncbi:hypothetical protein BDZ94DRAFT_1252929 [Collybia nuda]|uniref:Uncharacterized protein n=1 Tax=Collybia nuda TaxID=64659 RepID=A0A9P5YBI9_9AGAR|nr:hypothetical protein BDZ94DRAFT_1252929 [Collybia nuda]